MTVNILNCETRCTPVNPMSKNSTKFNKPRAGGREETAQYISQRYIVPANKHTE